MSVKLPARLLFLILTLTLLSACGSELAATTTPVPPTPTIIPLPTDTSTVNPTPTLAILQGWESRWLKGIPCTPPCWEGVTPGKTTSEEALELLRKLPFIKSAEIIHSKFSDVGDYIVWSWIDGNPPNKSDNGNGGELNIKKVGLTSTIDVIRTRLPKSFKLSEIITAFGEPEYVTASVYLPPESNKNQFRLDLIFIQHGFTIRAASTTDGFSEIKPVLSNDLELYNPVFSSQIIGSYFYHSVRELLVPWQGLKDFEFYCRDKRDTGIEDCSRRLKARP